MKLGLLAGGRWHGGAVGGAGGVSRWMGMAAAGAMLLAGGLADGAPVTVTRTNYLGWPDAQVMRNGEVEVVVVPAIGRVQQFGFAGEPGVFWENPELSGRTGSTNLNEWKTADWVNFGGDKAWPAPESAWSNWTPRKSWRPPPAFDGLPHTARVDGDAVVMTSPEDPYLGIQVTRRVELTGPTTLRITTEFEKRSGNTLTSSVWVVTQLRDPVRLQAAVPAKSIFRRGYVLLSPQAPPDLKVEAGFLSLSRARSGSFKIGLDASALLWVGERHCLRISNPRRPGHLYPDHGSNLEIYTNPDPLPYIELESLGPLQELSAKPPGRKTLTETVTYELFRRAHPTPEAEAKALLAP